MSCSIPTKLVSYYSNKVNIYDSDCFIRLPNYITCPPPPCIYIAPQMVFPPAGPYIPPAICPVPQPLNPPGLYCGQINAPYNPPCNNIPSQITGYGSNTIQQPQFQTSECTTCGS